MRRAGGGVMRCRMRSVWMAMFVVACQACAHGQAGQPAEVDRSAATGGGGSQAAGLQEASKSREGTSVGDCSRCYVELWNPSDPLVRTRLCGRAPAEPGLKPSLKKKPPDTAPPDCCQSLDGGTRCKNCDVAGVSSGGPAREFQRDYIISVGPDAEVTFERAGRTVTQRGPLEFTSEEVGIDEPLPLNISCRAQVGSKEGSQR